jgi:hypothetical protein
MGRLPGPVDLQAHKPEKELERKLPAQTQNGKSKLI